MTVGVKRKSKRSFVPVLPKIINTEKKGKGSTESKELQSVVDEQFPPEGENDIESIEKEDTSPKGEANFLEDLIWVYSKLGGRTALLARARRDPVVKNQVFQTLLRMEAKKQEIEAKRKDKVGDGKKGLLLIMKGMEDPEKGLKAPEGKLSKRDVLNILEPGSNMDEEGIVNTDDYRYNIQEVTDEESKKINKEGQDTDSAGREEEVAEDSAGGEEIIMDSVVDE